MLTAVSGKTDLPNIRVTATDSTTGKIDICAAWWSGPVTIQGTGLTLTCEGTTQGDVIRVTFTNNAQSTMYTLCEIAMTTTDA